MVAISNNYTVYHCHTMLSNATTTMDSVTHYKDYVDRAKELGMKALAFTEHGNILSWLRKKEYTESKGLKYIHGVEAYLTMSIEEKTRDNYHVILLAKNYEGVKELNKMYSFNKAYNRDDGHFHYSPRISIEELEETSDNIVITSACLGNILSKDIIKVEGKAVSNIHNQKRFIDFLVKNKHRCFLEIQHHNVLDQKRYNQRLYDLSLTTGIRLIAGTDTHCLNEEHVKGRDILQKAKFIYFDDEDGWDLTFKSYDKLVQAYEEQKCLDREVYLEAIENTNVMADMIEEFEVDRSYKYPKLHKDSNGTLKRKIIQGARRRGIKEFTNIQKERIFRELDAIETVGAVDYMLLEEDIKSYCRKEGIGYGYGRGSVSGSYIAYLLGITDMDSVRYDLIFERFINPSRVNLCD